MSGHTIIPRTDALQRPGLDGALVRVLLVDLHASTSCVGGRPLHLAKGVRVADGAPCSWFVTDDDARRFGWVQ